MEIVVRSFFTLLFFSLDQITYPVDEGVTRNILANLDPWPVDIANVYNHPLLTAINEEVVHDYMLNAQKWCYNRDTNQLDNVKVRIGGDEMIFWIHITRVLIFFHRSPILRCMALEDEWPREYSQPFRSLRSFLFQNK